MRSSARKYSRGARLDESRREVGAADRGAGVAFFLVTFSWRNKKKPPAIKAELSASSTETSSFVQRIFRRMNSPLQADTNAARRLQPALTDSASKGVFSDPCRESRVFNGVHGRHRQERQLARCSALPLAA